MPTTSSSSQVLLSLDNVHHPLNFSSLHLVFSHCHHLLSWSPSSSSGCQGRGAVTQGLAFPSVVTTVKLSCLGQNELTAGCGSYLLL